MTPDRLREAGFGDDEISQYLTDAGFTAEEIGSYLGKEAPAPPQQEPGFIARTHADLQKRYENMVGAVKPALESPSAFLHEAPEAGLRVLGQTAGAAADILTEAGKSAYETFVPKPAQETLKAGALSVLDTPVGKMGVRAVQAGVEAYQKFKKEYPNAAADLEAVLNIGAMLPVGRGAAAATLKAAEVTGLGWFWKTNATTESGTSVAFSGG